MNNWLLLFLCVSLCYITIGPAGLALGLILWIALLWAWQPGSEESKK